MAWTYSDYESQATPALRLARARLFRQEVVDSISADYSINGRSKSHGNLIQLLAQIDKDILRYGRATGSGFTRGRPV